MKLYMIQNPSSLALSYIQMWNKHEKNWFQYKIQHTHTCTRIYIKIYTYIFFQNRGLWECAFCTPLYTFSFLTYALTGKKKINDKTQLSASFPWGNQKTKKNKKTTLSQALWPSRSSWVSVFFVFLVFLFFLFVFLFFYFFCFFGFS
jgi:ATP-dependent Zn protease